jgi:hypothetical protein
MAINYVAALKTTRMTAVGTAIDAGGAAGKLNIYSAAYANLLVSIPLAFPSYNVAGAVLSLLGTPLSGVAIFAGTGAIARIYTSADVLVADGLTVGLAGTDIIIDNTNIAVGQTVNLNSGTITHG